MPDKIKISNIFFRIIGKSIDLIIVLIIWNIFSDPGLLAGVLYLLISDGLFKGKSIGKKFMRLKVINLENKAPADFRASVIRNLLLSISLFLLKIPIIGWMIFLIVYAIEFIIIIGDSEARRLGDYLAKTSVIEE